MTHPTMQEVLTLADEVRNSDVHAHVLGCAMCRTLAESCGIRLVDASVELSIVPRAVYERVDVLHRGGMGQTTIAIDTRLDRKVVLKEMFDRDSYPDIVTYQRLRERFVQEARTTASLSHPSIIAVHEAGWWPNGEPFYAMPFIEGERLTDAIAHSRRASKSGVDQAAQDVLLHVARVADAIGYAHENGVVHRDVKPDNVLVGAFGETVVIDWGLARDVSEASSEGGPAAGQLTRWGVGTAEYMPPEQSEGAPADPRMDVYALGIVLNEALQPHLPPELASVVEKATDARPERRFSDARALSAELNRYLKGELLECHQYTLFGRAMRWANRHRAIAVSGLVSMVVLSAVSVAAFLRVSAAKDSADRALREARGALASQWASQPHLRVQALEMGLSAVRGEAAPPPAAQQGLLNAVWSKPAAVALPSRANDCLVIRDRANIWAVGAGRVAHLDLSTSKPRAEAPHPLSACRLARLSPDGTTLITTMTDQVPIRTDLGSLKSEALALPASLYSAVAFNGGQIGLADTEGRLHVVRKAGVQSVTLDGPVSGLRTYREGFVAATHSGGVWYIDETRKTPLLEGSEGLVAIAVHEEQVVVAAVNGRVWSIGSGSADGHVVRPADGQRINSLEVASGVVFITLRFVGVELRTRSGQLIRRHRGRTASNFGPGHSGISGNSGRYVVLAPQLDGVAVHDLETGAVLTEYRGRPGMNDVGFIGPDIVFVTGDRGAVAFDARTQGPRHTGEVSGLFSKDQTLFSAGLDGRVLAWGPAAQEVTRLDRGIVAVRGKSPSLLVDIDHRVHEFDGQSTKVRTGTVASRRRPEEGISAFDGDVHGHADGRVCWPHRAAPRGSGTKTSRRRCAQLSAPVTSVLETPDAIVAGLTTGAVRWIATTRTRAEKEACEALAVFDRSCR